MFLTTAFYSCVLYLFTHQASATPIDNDGFINEVLSNGDGNKTITDATLKSAIQFAQMLMSSSYAIPAESYSYFNQDNSVKVKVSNGSVTDPSQFTVDKAHVNMSNLEFDVHLTFPSLNVTGLYYINASTDVFKVFGNGPFRLNTTGIETEINVKLGQHENKTIYLKDVDLDYNITSTSARFDGLLNDTEACNLMNDLINEFIPDALHDFKSNIDSEGAILAEQYSAFLFNNVTLDQLINFINGLAG